MANVKICDRCGKKIEPKIWPVYIQPVRSLVGLEDDACAYRYDLCGSCTTKLFEFIKNGEYETDEHIHAGGLY